MASPAIMIRQARQEKKWTQRQLAEQIGCTPGFVNKIEAGASLPGYERCLALASVLGLSSEELWSQIEKAKTEVIKKRIQSRGTIIQKTLTPQDTPRAPSAESAPHTIDASEIARDLEQNPTLRSAYMTLKKLLEDDKLREGILQILNTFADSTKKET